MHAYKSAAKWVSLLLAVSLFFTGMPIYVNSADDGTAVNGTACYGYTTLTPDEQLIYRTLHAAVQSDTPDQMYLLYNCHFTQEEIENIVDIYVSDHPEAFWFLGAFLYGYGNLSGSEENPKYGVLLIPLFELNGMYFTNTIYTVGTPDDSSDDNTPINDISVLAKAKEDFTNRSNALYVEMGMAGMLSRSDEEKALWLHDKAAGIVTYENTSNDQTAYGALVEGKAVCTGYTALYQYLLQMVGIRSFRVTGVAKENGSVELVPHAWNLVWIDDVCVYTDLTWDDAQLEEEDDSGEELWHLYYNRGFGDFHETDHAYSDLYVGRLPQCSDKCDNFYMRSVDVIPGEFTPAAIAARAVLSSDGKSYTVKAADTTGKLFDWVVKNIESVGRKLGLDGALKYKIAHLPADIGTEVQLTFQSELPITPRPAVQGSILLGSASPDDLVRIELIPASSEVIVYEIEKYACEGEYILRNIPSGTYTVRVSAPKHVAREYTVTIP